MLCTTRLKNYRELSRCTYCIAEVSVLEKFLLTLSKSSRVKGLLAEIKRFCEKRTFHFFVSAPYSFCRPRKTNPIQFTYTLVVYGTS